MAPAQSKLASALPLRTRLEGGSGAAAIAATLLALVYLRRKVVQAAQEAADRRNQAVLTTPQIELAQRELYNPLPGGARELLVPNRGRVSKVTIRPTKATTFAAHRPLFRRIAAPAVAARKAGESAAASTNAAAQRVGVNKDFFRQLAAIWRIIVPRATCKEVGLISAHTTFLLLRTYLSLLVARLDGKLVGDLVRRFLVCSVKKTWPLTQMLSQVSANGKGFLRGLVYWFLLAIPSVYTNAMIRFLQSKLAISFRTRLTRYVHDLYLDKNNTFYRVVNLDARIGANGADQLVRLGFSLTCFSRGADFVETGHDRHQPVLRDSFCALVSQRAIQLDCPLDSLTANSLGQLERLEAGSRPRVVQYSARQVPRWQRLDRPLCLVLCHRLDPAQGHASVWEACGGRSQVGGRLSRSTLEAHHQLGGSRVRFKTRFLACVGAKSLTSSERSSFYDGGAIEKDILTRAYLRLIKHVNSIFKVKPYSCTET